VSALPRRPKRISNIVILKEGPRRIILDPLTTKWVFCDQEAYRLFRNCDGHRSVRDLVGGRTSVSARRVLKQLVSAGFVYQKKPPVRKARDWPDGFAEVMFASMHVSADCNMRCRYCYAEAGDRRNQMMPFDVVTKTIDRLMALPCRRLTIHWGGGEPLLAFETVLRGVAYARRMFEKVGKDIKFLLQTNGTLLTRQKARILNEMGVEIGISIDGPPGLDCARVYPDGGTTSADTLQGIKNALQEKCQFGVIVTLTSISADHVEEVLDYLLNLGISEIKINPCQRLGRAAKNPKWCVSPTEFLKAKIKAFEHLAERNPKLLLGNSRKLLENLSFPVKSSLCHSTPSCGAGLRMLGFDTNGDVYPCDQFVGTSPELLVGNIFMESLSDMLRSPVIMNLRRRTVYELKKCSNCIWRHFCGAGCAVAAFWYYRTLLKEDPYCEFRKRFYRYLLHKAVERPAVLKEL